MDYTEPHTTGTMREHNLVVICAVTRHNARKSSCVVMYGGPTLQQRQMHPGQYVRTMFMEPNGLTVTDAARVLGVTRPALSRFLNEKAHLSSDMALRIEKAFGTKMDELMQMQVRLDIEEARKRAQDVKVLPFRRNGTK
ncbi:HigA family addiction module antitoxin [Paenirhodobacter enshiensis]|uniref:HigA family addiction module antitoxin n=1 Tax=Paenirhodobacter enshiensis TaxID=1105367 RepID=UPI0035B360EC